MGAGEGYEVDAVPSMRMIVNLANLDDSRWIQLTGNSGHAFHPNYADQFELWRTGQTLPMRWNRGGHRGRGHPDPDPQALTRYPLRSANGTIKLVSSRKQNGAPG